LPRSVVSGTASGATSTAASRSACPEALSLGPGWTDPRADSSTSRSACPEALSLGRRPARWRHDPRLERRSACPEALSLGRGVAVVAVDGVAVGRSACPEALSLGRRSLHRRGRRTRGRRSACPEALSLGLHVGEDEELEPLQVVALAQKRCLWDPEAVYPQQGRGSACSGALCLRPR